MHPTKTASSKTPTYYACGRSLYERGNDDRPAAECYTDADCVALASQSARIAELEGALRELVNAAAAPHDEFPGRCIRVVDTARSLLHAPALSKGQQS